MDQETPKFNSAEEALAFIRAGDWKRSEKPKRCGSGGCDGCKCKKNQEPKAATNWHNEIMEEMGHFEDEEQEGK